MVEALSVVALLFVLAVVAPLVWPRRRWVRSVVKPSAPPSPIDREQMRRWREQAIEEEHAFWADRFRAAGGYPPLRKVERERMEADPVMGYFFRPGSNSRFTHTVVETPQQTAARLRERTTYQPRLRRSEWRTSLRDLVDPG